MTKIPALVVTILGNIYAVVLCYLVIVLVFIVLIFSVVSGSAVNIWGDTVSIGPSQTSALAAVTAKAKADIDDLSRKLRTAESDANVLRSTRISLAELKTMTGISASTKDEALAAIQATVATASQYSNGILGTYQKIVRAVFSDGSIKPSATTSQDVLRELNKLMSYLNIEGADKENDWQGTLRAIKNMQKKFGSSEDGKLGKETLKTMGKTFITNWFE